MTTSTTSIDIMGLQAAYANLHTDQERDYFMQRYHAVISSFGGKTSYDVDKRPLLVMRSNLCVFFFSSRRRHTRFDCDWSSDVCSSDLTGTYGSARPSSPRASPSRPRPRTWRARTAAPSRTRGLPSAGRH